MGSGFQPGKGVSDGDEKFVAKAGSLGLVPAVCFPNVRLSGFADENDRSHELREARTACKTSRQGRPGLPSRSNSARASSRSFRSPAPGPAPRTGRRLMVLCDIVGWSNSVGNVAWWQRVRHKNALPNADAWITRNNPNATGICACWSLSGRIDAVDAAARTDRVCSGEKVAQCCDRN